MRTRTLVFALIAGSTLAGCGGMQGGAVIMNSGLIPTTCDNSQRCVIPVSVTACVVSIPGDFQDVSIKSKNVSIIWELTAPAVKSGYRFASRDGVVLKSSTPDNGHWYTGKQFSGQGTIAHGTGFMWIDKNSDWDAYLYTINVIDTANGDRACTPLDPRVINN